MSNQKARVVLISQDFYPMKGGIARHLLNLYKYYLKDTDFSAIIPIGIGSANKLKKLPFKVYQTDFSPFKEESKRKDENNKILSLLGRIKPDRIIFGYLRSHPETGIEYRKLNPKVKIGLIAHAKELFIKKAVTSKTNVNGAQKGYSVRESNFYINILKDMDYIFCVSNFSKDLLISQGVKNSLYTLYPILDKKILSKRFEINIPPKKDFVVLSVGRLIERKGQLKVVKAVESIIKENKDIKYNIIGDGPELNKIKDYIDKKDLNSKIKILTNISDKELSHYYRGCDIFVLPCDFIKPNDIEGFGIVFLEANYYGKPCIGGTTGGVKEAIINGKTGLLVDPKNSKQLTNKIKLLIDNPSLKRKLGLNAQNRVKNKFLQPNNKYFKEFIYSD